MNMRFFGRRKEKTAGALPTGGKSFFPDVPQAHWSIWNDVRHATMTSAQRVFALCDAVDYLCREKISGDIVECGVWRGGSMMAAAKCLLAHGDVGRRLWLYDTFAGMSQPTVVDVDHCGLSAASLVASPDPKIAESVSCRAALSDVRRNMSTTRYPESLTTYVVGDVSNTLRQSANLPTTIALLRLDTDWYESTRVELEVLFPRLVGGGVLVVDDYGHWQGCRRAVDEYLCSNGVSIYLHRIDYTGRIGVKAVLASPREINDAA
jgi:hypothetical protein